MLEIFAAGRARRELSSLVERVPRVVHRYEDGGLTAPPIEEVRPGDMVSVEVTYAAPHHLVSDAPVMAVRRTRSGDAWEARQARPSSPGVLLGLPTVGVPAPLAPVSGCG